MKSIRPYPIGIGYGMLPSLAITTSPRFSLSYDFISKKNTNIKVKDRYIKQNY